jgi:hypothetical protein
MFRCARCGSINQNSGACGICGGSTSEIQRESFSRQSPRRLKSFWTATKIIVLTVVVLVAISSVGAGLYLSARPSGPSCSNQALNYPSCNTCGSSETYTVSTNVCSCTNQAVNPPSCDRYCANNAINPPACDRCPDNQTDVVCPPGVPPEMTESITVSSLDMLHSRTGGDISTG